MNPEEPNKTQAPPASQSTPPVSQSPASNSQANPPITSVQQPTTSVPTQPGGSKNSLKIILAVISGIVLIIIVAIVAMAFSGSKKQSTEVTPTATSTSTASSSSSAPSLPSGYVPVDNACYRAAAPTDHKLSNDSACYIHVYYGTDKSAGYMVAEMTGDSNASSVESWKKSNTYPIVSEESIKVGGLDAKKIVYSVKVGSSTKQGVIVFVATPGKNYKDGSFDIKGFEISAATYGNDADKSKATFDTVIDNWYWK